MIEQCPNCDGPVVEEMVTYSFPFGIDDPVTLTVTHLGFTCHNCKTITTDWRGEDARAAAVVAFLSSRDDPEAKEYLQRWLAQISKEANA